jgi:hypothetical protein
MRVFPEQQHVFRKRSTLDCFADNQQDELRPAARYGHLIFKTPRLEDHLFKREVVVLEQGPTGHEPVVDIQVYQLATVLVVPKIVVRIRTRLPVHQARSEEPEVRDNCLKRFPVSGIYEQIQIPDARESLG